MPTESLPQKLSKVTNEKRPTELCLPAIKLPGVLGESNRHFSQQNKCPDNMELSTILVPFDSPAELNSESKLLGKSNRTPDESSHDSSTKASADLNPRVHSETTPKGAPFAKEFIIGYDGSFVGAYQSTKKITGRTAYKIIGHALKAKVPGFDPDKLRLFKPNPIEAPKSQVMAEVSAGVFSWFFDDA